MTMVGTVRGTSDAETAEWQFVVRLEAALVFWGWSMADGMPRACDLHSHEKREGQRQQGDHVHLRGHGVF